MLFRKTAARKSCSALRCAAQKHGHGSKIKEQLTAHVFKLYDICTEFDVKIQHQTTKSSEIQRVAWRVYDICIEFDVKIQQQIFRNPTGAVEGFHERSGRAPGAKTPKSTRNAIQIDKKGVKIEPKTTQE